MPKFALLLLLALLLGACASASAGEAPTLAPPPAATPSPSSESIPTPTPPPAASPTAAPTASPTTSPSPTLSPTPTAPPITTLLFTGVIVPARCVQAALDANGNPDHPYEEVRQTIQKADLAIGVFNATMSDQVEHTGCFITYQLVGSPNNADALQRAGFDVMNVATNHIKDCGPMKSWCDSVFFDTLDNLQRVGIETVGAGANLDEALQPLVVTVNGTRFGFVALGDSKQSEVVFASDTNPGIALLNEENMRAAIEAARQVSDVVIAMPHWGSEDILLPNWLQREQARYIVDAGADLVVGNHTHVIQAFHQLDGIPVFYGLGNFVFDQDLRDHRQGVILLVRFEGARFLDYEMIFTLVDKDGRVHFTSPEESAQIIERLQQANDLLD